MDLVIRQRVVSQSGRPRRARRPSWPRTAALAAALLAAGCAVGARAGISECDDATPAWVFCSGFEEGSFDLWDDYDGNPATTNQLLADPGPFGRDGNHVARFFVPPGAGIADLIKVLPASYDRLYLRWYCLWEEGYDFAAPNHGSGLHAGTRSLLAQSGYRPDGTDRFNSYLEPLPGSGRLATYSYYPGMYMDCADPEGACWGDRFPCLFDEGERICDKPEHRETVTPPQPEAGRWYCLELFIDGGTPTPGETGADGTIDFWIDGVEYGPWTGLWMRSTPDLKLTILWLKLYHHGEHAPVGIRIDDVVVSTAPIGPRRSGGSPAGETSWSGLKRAYR